MHILWFAVLRVITCETVLEVGEVSVEDTDDFEGTEEVGEDSTLYCRSEILEGRGRSRDDFCRINLEEVKIR